MSMLSVSSVRCCGSFVVFAGLLFDRHSFGERVRAVGDNPDSASQMGMNVARVRISTFVFMGLGAALAGVLSTMVDFTGGRRPETATPFPRSPPFSGGTPTWGGVGTVVGGRSAPRPSRSSKAASSRRA